MRRLTVKGRIINLTATLRARHETPTDFGKAEVLLKKITINMSGAWVRSHRGDDSLPAEIVRLYLKNEYGDKAVINTDGLTAVTVEINEAEIAVDRVKSDIESIFERVYNEKPEGSAYVLLVEENDDVANVLADDALAASLTKHDVTAETETPESADGKADKKPSADESSEKENPELTDLKSKSQSILDRLKASVTVGRETSKPESEKSGFDESLLGAKKFDESLLGGSKTDGKDESLAGKASADSNDLLSTLDGYEGWFEFKDLIYELVTVAPQLKANGCLDVMNNRGYIFSIDDGCGLTTACETLCSAMKELGIMNLGKNALYELPVEIPKNDHEPPFAKCEATIAEILTAAHGKPRAFCFDISEWMSQLDGADFRKVLAKAGMLMEDNLVIFRVPFVNKEVLLRIDRSLNDMFSFRTISFEPLTNEETKSLAEKEFAKHGFKVARGAWSTFFDKVAEEKSDGRYYGVKTVKKIVSDVLYEKNIKNARLKKNDLTIGKKDFAAVCYSTVTNAVTGMQMLDELVGDDLKNKIREIISQIEFARSTANGEPPCIHMRFVGNPGTGKTTVARIIGRILKEKGLLRLGNFYEYSGRDLCGQYIGSTAPKTAGICRDAYGSVLFIDEAYSLYNSHTDSKDYGREALDTLIAEMENHRDDLLVIMAGYTDEMDKLMEGNAGLKSRMPYTIEFPNFSREQLFDIFKAMANKNFSCDDKMLPAAKAFFDSIPDSVLNAKDFSNARFVRNLYERTWAKAALRVQLARTKTLVLTKDDFDRAICEKDFLFPEKKKNRIGFI